VNWGRGLGAMLSLTGIVMLFYFASWQVALGATVLVWGNNLERRYE
jgi:hypothetical protein